jgi:hypothetical protein
LFSAAASVLTGLFSIILILDLKIEVDNGVTPPVSVFDFVVVVTVVAVVDLAVVAVVVAAFNTATVLLLAS